MRARFFWGGFSDFGDPARPARAFLTVVKSSKLLYTPHSRLVGPLARARGRLAVAAPPGHEPVAARAAAPTRQRMAFLMVETGEGNDQDALSMLVLERTPHEYGGVRLRRMARHM